MLEATIHLIDPMNPSIGYRVHITRGRETVLLTSRDPASGKDLLTFTDATRVLAYYE